jgi:hypothetical protein
MINLNDITFNFSKDLKKYTAIYRALIIGGNYKYHCLEEVREETPDSAKEYRRIVMTQSMSDVYKVEEGFLFGFPEIKAPVVLLQEINIAIPYIIATEYKDVEDLKEK